VGSGYATGAEQAPCEAAPVHVTWRADDGTLAKFRARALSEPLSYAEVGRSLDPDLPAGYGQGRDVVTLGADSSTLAAGADGLRHWVCHEAIGVRVWPRSAPLTEGTTVALALPIAGLWILAASRIVRVIDEPDRFGFAYGTLRSHPEVGEEAFVVQRDGDEVTFTITVFWRPADAVVRVGGPVTRHVQRRATLGYLDGLARHVRDGTR
jgi:uncharacterized protein (UPF0548 family)